MKVLFCVDEAYPLYKIGGLGDVGGSLPIALYKLQVDVRIALPKHPEIDISQSDWHTIDHFNIVYKNQQLPVTVYSGFLPGSNVPVYLFEETVYLSAHTDASDNHADKFTVFSLCIASWLHQPNPSWHPSIIHLQDWHTAMVPVIIKHRYPTSDFKYITTIHNLAYQGNTDSPILKNLGLNINDCKILSWDSIDNHINILLEGLLHSDIISTVSPTYAGEILTDEYGEKIDTILQSRKSQIVGILNGLDYQVFDPSSDQYLDHHYSAKDVVAGKLANKHQLQQELELPQSDLPLIGFVGRVDAGQKGIALIIEALANHQLPPPDTQLVFLGTGDPILEQQLHQQGDEYKNCRIITRFDEPLARRIYAASDLMLIPSRYEPCGLVQMIAMRYGTLPIARKTGGLADTIIHGHDGFLFNDYSSQAMVDALSEALGSFSQPHKRQAMIDAAINKNFTWDEPAKEYVALYEHLVLES